MVASYGLLANIRYAPLDRPPKDMIVTNGPRAAIEGSHLGSVRACFVTRESPDEISDLHQGESPPRIHEPAQRLPLSAVSKLPVRSAPSANVGLSQGVQRMRIATVDS
jgi:hypothetical protein